MNFTFKQLRYFIAVAECGNVTAASEQLFISQPAISNAIIQLEESFGVQLLVRHHAKGVSLTSAGKEFLGQAASLLAHADDVDGSMKQHSTTLSGTINLGCFVTLAPLYIPSVIKRFNEHYPEVDFNLHEGDQQQLSDALTNGRIEAAIIYDLNLEDNFDTEVLSLLPPRVMLASDHPLAKKKRIDLVELRDEPMILIDLPHSREYFKSLFHKHKFEPTIRHKTKSFELARSLVANGRGYSISNLSPQTNICYDGSEVVSRELSEETSALTIVVAKISEIKLPKRVEIFIDYCKEYFDDPSKIKH